MLKEERYQYILNELYTQGKVMVNELSVLFRVSNDTIRRDLLELERVGKLKRVFGGALPLHLPVASYTEREKVGNKIKYQLAQKALAFIAEDQLIVLDGSSTNHMLARFLPRTIRLTVLTNSFPIAEELRNHKNIKVIILGGEYMGESMTTVGDGASRQLEEYHPDICFMGFYALDKDFGISVPYQEEQNVKRVMVHVSKKVILLLQQEKVDKKSKYQIATMEEIDVLVTEPEEKIKMKKCFPNITIV